MSVTTSKKNVERTVIPKRFGHDHYLGGDMYRDQDEVTPLEKGHGDRLNKPSFC